MFCLHFYKVCNSRLCSNHKLRYHKNINQASFRDSHKDYNGSYTFSVLANHWLMWVWQVMLPAKFAWFPLQIFYHYIYLTCKCSSLFVILYSHYTCTFNTTLLKNCNLYIKKSIIALFIKQSHVTHIPSSYTFLLSVHILWQIHTHSCK